MSRFRQPSVGLSQANITDPVVPLEESGTWVASISATSKELIQDMFTAATSPEFFSQYQVH